MGNHSKLSCIIKFRLAHMRVTIKGVRTNLLFRPILFIVNYYNLVVCCFISNALLNPYTLDYILDPTKSLKSPSFTGTVSCPIHGPPFTPQLITEKITLNRIVMVTRYLNMMHRSWPDDGEDITLSQIILQCNIQAINSLIMREPYTRTVLILSAKNTLD